MGFCLTLRMVDCMFVQTGILLISCCILTAQCAQINCTSVADFDDCRGNVTDFCPKNSVCACKDGQPFCKCPNFRSRWQNYWYMGAKCDQLWSTQDLILVAALPGIGLALIVGVTMQTIYYCKKKPTKNVDDHREQKNVPQYDSVYALDTDMRPSPHNQGQNLWNSSTHRVFPRSSGSPPSAFPGRNYNSRTHEPREEYPHNFPFYDGSQGRAQPETNYGSNYFPTMHMKPLFNSSTQGAPKPSYIQRERQQIGYPGSEEPTMPYRPGAMQMKFNY
ncbi:uncharacterized protein LOC123522506 [Echinops telfairi]|uniref:Uncharacterized protein LOC123522506 n=1 Tax=Echinops telfairi TaxID=9371 RepID=A0AC55DNI6_ECHTE|nr:uncharacterized protein LOC123522506 [Echinops telfairi]